LFVKFDYPPTKCFGWGMRLLSFVICFALVGCSITRTKQISFRDELFYEANSSKLINGKVTIPGGFFENVEGQTKGKIKEGKRTGLWTSFYPNGKIASTINWVNNLQDGLATEWYESGQKKIEANYKDDKQDGLATEWYENGQKKAEGNFKGGKRNGLLTYWYENGQMQEQVNYLRGKPNGLVKLWKINGDLHAQYYAKHGKKHGDCIHFYPNGTKERVHNFENGTENGSSTSWYSNGNTQRESIWKNGKMISCSVWKPNGEKCTSTKIDNGDGVIVFYNDEGEEVGKNYFKNGKELSF